MESILTGTADSFVRAVKAWGIIFPGKLISQMGQADNSKCSFFDASMVEL
jgi:hypothetical protein